MNENKSCSVKNYSDKILLSKINLNAFKNKNVTYLD